MGSRLVVYLPISSPKCHEMYVMMLPFERQLERAHFLIKARY